MPEANNMVDELIDQSQDLVESGKVFYKKAIKNKKNFVPKVIATCMILLAINEIGNRTGINSNIYKYFGNVITYLPKIAFFGALSFGFNLFL